MKTSKDRSAQHSKGEIKMKKKRKRKPQSCDSLILAVAARDLEMVDKLLREGKDVNVQDENCLSAVMLALRPRGLSQFDHTSAVIVRKLLDAGADCTAIDREGKSVFHYACEAGVAAKYIAEHGADVNARDHEGRTPLMCAVTCKSNDSSVSSMVCGLLRIGADPFAEDRVGNTVWDYVQDPFSAMELMKAFDHLWRDSRGETVLMKLCRLGFPRLVRKFLDWGADPAIRNKEGRTALMISCEPVPDFEGFPDQLEIVKALIEHGADPMDGSIDEVPVTYLVSAAEELLKAVVAGDRRAVQRFLDMGISPNLIGNEEGSLLMIAARKGDLACVEMLLKAGADVNDKSLRARTKALVEASRARIIRRVNKEKYVLLVNLMIW